MKQGFALATASLLALGLSGCSCGFGNWLGFRGAPCGPSCSPAVGLSYDMTPGYGYSAYGDGSGCCCESYNGYADGYDQYVPSGVPTYQGGDVPQPRLENVPPPTNPNPGI